MDRQEGWGRSCWLKERARAIHDSHLLIRQYADIKGVQIRIRRGAVQDPEPRAALVQDAYLR